MILTLKIGGTKMKVVNILLTTLLLSTPLTYTQYKYKRQPKRRYERTHVQDRRRQQQEDVTCCTPTNVKNVIKISASLTKLAVTVLTKLIPIIIR